MTTSIATTTAPTTPDLLKYADLQMAAEAFLTDPARAARPTSSCTAWRASRWSRWAVGPGTHVTSDGLGCFAAVLDAGCVHLPIVVGTRKPRELPQFAWINTILGNLKTSLHGAYHSLGWAKHADTYLAAFAYRFNRRFDLRGLLARLIVDTARCEPHPISEIRGGAEAHY